MNMSASPGEHAWTHLTRLARLPELEVREEGEGEGGGGKGDAKRREGRRMIYGGNGMR